MAAEFDHAQLNAVTGDDVEFERELLAEYLSSVGADLARLGDAVNGGDAIVVGQIAHAIKGASATIGAKGFAALAMELERAGKSGDLAAAPRKMTVLTSEFEALSVFLRTRLSRAA